MAFKNVNKNVFAVYNKVEDQYFKLDIAEKVSTNPKFAGGEINVVSDVMGSTLNYIDTLQGTLEFDISFLPKLKGSRTVGNHLVLRTNDGESLETLLKSCMIYKTRILDGVTNNLIKEEFKVNSKIDQVAIDCTNNVDGESVNITGMVTNLQIEGKIGTPLKFLFNNKAYYDGIENQEWNPAVNVFQADDINQDAKIIFIDKLTGFTENGNTVNISEFKFNLNREAQNNYNVGVAEYAIVNYKPEITFTFLKIKNDLTAYDDLKNQNLKEIVISGYTQDSLLSNSDYASFNMTIPFAQLKSIENGEQNSRQTFTKTYTCKNLLGDDNFKFDFTANSGI